jgi:hypothetical protein
MARTAASQESPVHGQNAVHMVRLTEDVRWALRTFAAERRCRSMSEAVALLLAQTPGPGRNAKV